MLIFKIKYSWAWVCSNTASIARTSAKSLARASPSARTTTSTSEVSTTRISASALTWSTSWTQTTTRAWSRAATYPGTREVTRASTVYSARTWTRCAHSLKINSQDQASEFVAENVTEIVAVSLLEKTPFSLQFSVATFIANLGCKLMYGIKKFFKLILLRSKVPKDWSRHFLELAYYKFDMQK